MQSSEGEHHLYLVFTTGVPGLGKTYLLDRLLAYINAQPKHLAISCSSDLVRSTVLAEHYKSEGIDITKLSEEAIYKIEADSSKQISSRLYDTLVDLLKKLKESNNERVFFFLDKNFCSKDLVKYINDQVEVIFKGWEVHRRVIVPEDFKEGEDRHYYPLKPSTLLICLERSLKRKEHLTMKYGNIHSLYSFISCLQSQIKDPFDGKFPPSVYQRVVVDYYDRDIFNIGLQNNENRVTFDKFNGQVADLVDKKVDIPAGVDGLVDTLRSLESLNAYHKIEQKELAGLMDKIQASG